MGPSQSAVAAGWRANRARSTSSRQSSAGESNGIANQPNLYFAAPGAGPTFIATLSPEDPVVVDAVKESASRRMADFQLSASGRFAVFTTFQPLSEYDNAGHSEIYRYEAGWQIGMCLLRADQCPGHWRCEHGSRWSSLTEDGRVFFNQPMPWLPEISMKPRTPMSGSRSVKVRARELVKNRA